MLKSRNSTESPHLYFEFYSTHMIENTFTKIIIWGIYLLILAPIILLIHCIARKAWSRWFHMKILYSGTFLFFIFTFAPFMASVMYEWRYYVHETPLDIYSLIFSIGIGVIMVGMTVMLTFITC